MMGWNIDTVSWKNAQYIAVSILLSHPYKKSKFVNKHQYVGVHYLVVSIPTLILGL